MNFQKISIIQIIEHNLYIQNRLFCSLLTQKSWDKSNLFYPNFILLHVHHLFFLIVKKLAAAPIKFASFLY